MKCFNSDLIFTSFETTAYYGAYFGSAILNNKQCKVLIKPVTCYLEIKILNENLFMTLYNNSVE